MDASLITTRVADLIRNPDSAMPSKWEHSAKNKSVENHSSETSKSNSAPIPSPKPVTSSNSSSEGGQTTTLSSGDKLTLSSLAVKILEEQPGESDWEKARNEKVQRVQQLMHEKQYSLSPEMVDDIAHKIVALLH